ncbi:MAG: RNA pseudouridine synthase, partial [Firmicutes bacterium]|nr:RNA pseudouridine synthase [Bacillota bacterium]
MNEEATVKFLIDEEHAGLRADGVLSQLFEEASRSYVQKLIAGGHVFCDGTPLLSKKEKLKQGSEITIELPPAGPCEAVPQDIPLDIVYED